MSPVAAPALSRHNATDQTRQAATDPHGGPHGISERPPCPTPTALGLPCGGPLAHRPDGTLTGTCFSHMTQADQVAFRAARGRPSSGGSIRRPSAARLELHAAGLVRAATAAMTRYPAAWMTVVHCAATRAGMRRDGIAGLLAVAAVTASMSVHTSGRDAAPGRDVVAHALGITPQAVTRQWGRLRQLGVLRRGDVGAHLTADERDRLTAEHHAELAERNADREARGLKPITDRGPRWTRRASWDLVFPASVRSWSVEDLAPHLPPALSALAALAGQAAGSVSDTPSCSLVFVLSYVPVSGDRSTSGQGSKDVASRRAPARKSRACSRAGVSPEALILARELATGPVPWLRRVPYGVIGRKLDQLGLSGWTVADVVAAINARLAATGRRLPARMDRPVGYLAWCLADADPAAPPAQLDRARRVAEGDAVRERAEQRKAEQAEQDERAVTPAAATRHAAGIRAMLGFRGHDGARRRAGASRATQTVPDEPWPVVAQPPTRPDEPVGLVDQAATVADPSPDRQAAAAQAARDPRTCAVCHDPAATDVQLRPSPVGPVPRCGPCSTWLGGPDLAPGTAAHTGNEGNRST